MKTLVTFLPIFLVLSNVYAQNVGINETGSAPHSSAILHVESESGNKGVLIPRLTTAQRDAIVGPAQGLTIYNTSTNCFDYYSGSVWQSLCGQTSTSTEKPRMLGYGGGVGSAGRVVPTNSFHDIDVRITYQSSHVFVDLSDRNIQYRQTTDDWVNSSYPNSAVVLDGFLYLLIANQNFTPYEWRVYRYDVNNIAGGGTQMNLVGLSLGLTANFIQMTSNSSGVFYFTYEAGNSPSDFTVAKYNLVGTNLNYIGSVTFGSDPNSFDRIMVDDAGNVYGVKTSAVDDVVRKFDQAGAFIYVTEPYVLGGSTGRILNWEGAFYFGDNSIDKILNRVYLE